MDQLLRETIHDLVGAFLYYDRIGEVDTDKVGTCVTEDGLIDLIHRSNVTAHDIAIVFQEELEARWGAVKPAGPRITELT